MCLILARGLTPETANAKIKEEYLENGWESNDDACGFMAAVNGEFILQKYLKYKEFREAVDPYLNTNCPLVIHFRAASSSATATDLECAHPMSISETSGFAHNGFLDLNKHPTTRDYKKSDTVNFTNLVAKDLEKYMKDWWLNPGLALLLGKTIGSNNKLVFLNANGDSRIFNEKLGIWDEGIWYSNNMYKEKRVTSTAITDYYSTRNGNYHVTTYPKTTPTTTTPAKINGNNNGNNNDNSANNFSSSDSCLSVDDLEALDRHLDKLNAELEGENPVATQNPVVTQEVETVVAITQEQPVVQNIDSNTEIHGDDEQIHGSN